MIVTLQTHGTLTPVLSVRGGMIKIDLGALLLEMDTEGFKKMMEDIFTQATELDIDILC